MGTTILNCFGRCTLGEHDDEEDELFKTFSKLCINVMNLVPFKNCDLLKSRTENLKTVEHWSLACVRCLAFFWKLLEFAMLLQSDYH